MIQLRRSTISIYGTALLSICLLLGISTGTLIGWLVGIDADLGGVGIAMLLLIVSSDWLQRTGRMQPHTEAGVAFWSSIYIPIIVAMAASQNVLSAIQGGAVAIIAGAVTVLVCFGLVGTLTRYGQSSAAESDQK